MQVTQEITSVLVRQLMRPGILTDQQTDEAADALEGQYDAILDALSGIPRDHAEVLHLRFVVCLTHGQIAARLRITSSEVEALECAAISQLRASLPATRKAIAHSPAVMYQRTHKSTGTRYVRSKIFAWLDQHPRATIPEITGEFGMGHATAYRVRVEWRDARQKKAQLFSHEPRVESLEDDLSVLDMPEAETVARFALTPIKPSAPTPISAPASRTWYEEQVAQARTFLEVTEESERAAFAYWQQAQQQTKAARDRYDHAVTIAQAQHAMQHGQLIESLREA